MLLVDSLLLVGCCLFGVGCRLLILSSFVVCCCICCWLLYVDSSSLRSVCCLLLVSDCCLVFRDWCWFCAFRNMCYVFFVGCFMFVRAVVCCVLHIVVCCMVLIDRCSLCVVRGWLSGVVYRVLHRVGSCLAFVVVCMWLFVVCC